MSSLNLVKVKNEVAQSCLTLCDPMDWCLLGSSIHGIFQARVLEWVAISFSRGSSQSRDGTHTSHISCTARELLTNETTEKLMSSISLKQEKKAI